MQGASNPDIVSTRQQRIAELAGQAPQMGFTSLNHHLDARWLYEAFLRTRSDGATEVDGQTAQDYAANLPGNLQALVKRQLVLPFVLPHPEMLPSRSPSPDRILEPGLAAEHDRPFAV
jgi:hypothetical protein